MRISLVASNIDTLVCSYARTDEIGVPYGLTIDFQTVEDDTVTLRDLRTTQQVRLKVPRAPAVLLVAVC